MRKLSPSARPRRRERGQGSLESLGVVILAAVLVAATVGAVTFSSTPFEASVKYQICKLVNIADGGGDCQTPEEAAQEEAEERLPDEPCVIGSTGGSAEVGGSFLFVSASTGKEFLVEELSDGTFKITEVDKGAIGLTAGAPGAEVGITLDGVKYGWGASASAEAMLAGKKGETWYAGDKGELKDLLDTMNTGNIVDAVTPDKFLGFIPNPINSGVKDLVGGNMPDSDESFIEGGLEGSAQASVEAAVFGAGGELGAGNYLGAKKTPDGYTAYYKTSANGSAWGTWLMLEGQLQGSVENLVEVNFDKDGRPTSVSVTAGVSYGADVQITLQGDEREYTEVKATVPLTGDLTNDAETLALASSPLGLQSFLDKAKDDGTLTRNVYSDDPNTYGFNVEGAFGGKVGLNASGDVTMRDLTEAQYWDGEEMADRPDCSTD